MDLFGHTQQGVLPAHQKIQQVISSVITISTSSDLTIISFLKLLDLVLNEWLLPPELRGAAVVE
jgi:hypothetical protein